jgi:hypothetical protein
MFAQLFSAAAAALAATFGLGVALWSMDRV